MNWRLRLNELTIDKKWNLAIELMEKIITENPQNLDAYLSINYLLMNILVEEDYETKQHDQYANLLKKYFLESYSKFSNNPEYLFYTGITAFMSEWYFNIDIEDARKMIVDALKLDPENLLYKWGYNTYLDMENVENNKKAQQYALTITEENSPYRKRLESKGFLGKYILEIMKV